MKHILIYSSIAFMAIFSAACSKHVPAEEHKTAVLSDSIVKNVQTVPVVLDEEFDFVKLNGKIVPDETRLSKVFSLVSGKTESVFVELGDYVRKGQTLTVLKSTEVASISNDLSIAKSSLLIAKKNMETTKDLYEGNLSTEQEYLNAKVNYEKAVSELNKVEQVAAITGGQSSSYTITAPINGYVIEKNITNNSEVRLDNSNDLFVIADLSKVWIIANVYEADMNKIHIGDSARVCTLVNPDHAYLGRIDKIYNVLDPETRTMKVRISMDNPNNELKPEMFATITINGKSEGKALAIPSHAVVMDNSKNYVVVKKNTALKIQEINLTRRVGDKAYITGLDPGEQVVVESQVFLYQALRTN
ncbi:MAG TPA: efflux RND transporter periplasmic adaptor subunit [Ohtaekwangia sp.]|uniref:efflux RND transporter periplasmic adaptor subunit n=1 Tax=Ohtaekwangia sp. TaxID=2066019 RepID=UPI002F93F090